MHGREILLQSHLSSLPNGKRKDWRQKANKILLGATYHGFRTSEHTYHRSSLYPLLSLDPAVKKTGVYARAPDFSLLFLPFLPIPSQFSGVARRFTQERVRGNTAFRRRLLSYLPPRPDAHPSPYTSFSTAKPQLKPERPRRGKGVSIPLSWRTLEESCILWDEGERSSVLSGLTNELQKLRARLHETISDRDLSDLSSPASLEASAIKESPPMAQTVNEAIDDYEDLLLATVALRRLANREFASLQSHLKETELNGIDSQYAAVSGSELLQDLLSLQESSPKVWYLFHVIKFACL